MVSKSSGVQPPLPKFGGGLRPPCLATVHILIFLNTTLYKVEIYLKLHYTSFFVLSNYMKDIFSNNSNNMYLLFEDVHIAHTVTYNQINNNQWRVQEFVKGGGAKI